MDTPRKWLPTGKPWSSSKPATSWRAASATWTCDAIDAAFAEGRIAEEERYAQVEEELTDAYLAYREPWRQSAKAGDEAEWRWARELILDALPGAGGTFLDVGCANGYLMECAQRWGRERGLRLEPYGVDISWRLTSLARRRLPHWTDRIYEGNIVSWIPPRPFDLVNTGLDYVPPGRRRELVQHILRDVLAPGGRLVLRPERYREGVPTPADQLEELGFDPQGVIEARHPTNGEIRTTAWLAAP
ncbi:MAG: class I SAM-dependent methyltransferase [Chloroflexi bacterium]|nr:class I SAM-dependent methyltransferase [Chloroflexota bacterium]